MKLKSFKRIVYDLECNNLLQNMIDFKTMPLKLNDNAKLWCIVLMNLENPEEKVVLELDQCTKENLKECLKDCEELVAHNGVKFDNFVLQLFDILDYQLYFYPDAEGNNGEVFGKPIKFTDTLLLSKFLYPDRLGGHSLDSWGKRVDTYKTDYRKVCIDLELISPSSPVGTEFQQYYQPMKDYCIQDCLTTANTYYALLKEKENQDIDKAFHMETKLAELTVKQEFYGFEFNSQKALNNLKILTTNLEERRNKVNPILPPKKLNKGESASYLPPKNLFKKNGELTSHFIKFIEKLGAEINEDKTELYFENRTYLISELTPEICLKETIPADIEDLDHLKAFLITLGWEVKEWTLRDLTKASGKKIRLEDSKILETIDRYVLNTSNSLFKKQRLESIGVKSIEELKDFLYSKAKDNSLIVTTAPCIKVGVAKELCPNLVKLGDTVDFVKDVIEYLTYRHRRNSIANMDSFDAELGSSEKGFLANVEENGRIRTPADTMGAATFRYTHSIVANLPRASSLFGSEIRSMFGAGKDRIQLGMDFSSLEGRVQGHYVYPYEGGPQLAETLVAEKPNSIHCLSHDTKILTYNGWRGKDEIYNNTLIAQWDKNYSDVTYVHPLDILKRPLTSEEFMIHIEGDRLDILVSNKHRILVYNNKLFDYFDILAEDLIDYIKEYPDCYIPASGKCCTEDLKEILEYYSSKYIDQIESITEKEYGFVVRSFNLEIIEEIQTELTLSSVVSLIHTKFTGNKKRIYSTIIPKRESTLKGHSLKYAKITPIKHGYTKDVWCVTVPTSYIIIKRNNKIAIVGNCVNARNLGITRDEAKSFTYMLLYGAAPPKIAKSLGITLKKAEELYDKYWQSQPSLLKLKQKVEKYWISTNKTYIKAFDNRRLTVRSQHSLLNLLFQSAGALLVKYALVELCSRLDALGILGDPFKNNGVDERIYLMTVYHDEYQFSCPPSLFKIHKFKTEEEVKEFIKTSPLSKYGSYSHIDEEYWYSEDNLFTSLIEDSIDFVRRSFSFNVPFGFEWVTAKDWAGAH